MAKSPLPSQRESGPYSSITRYCRNGHFAAIVENMSVEALDSDNFSPRKPERYESREPMAALSGRHSKLVNDGKGCATICQILELSSCVSRFERSENLWSEGLAAKWSQTRSLMAFSRPDQEQKSEIEGVGEEVEKAG